MTKAFLSSTAFCQSICYSSRSETINSLQGTPALPRMGKLHLHLSPPCFADSVNGQDIDTSLKDIKGLVFINTKTFRGKQLWCVLFCKVLTILMASGLLCTFLWNVTGHGQSLIHG